jgi:hypothetical protein
MLAKKGRFEKVDVNAGYAPTINTLGNIVTGNIKNTVMEPWSALNGSATPLGCQLPTSAHECPQEPTIPCHNPLDQVKTSELELDEAAVVEEFEEFDVPQEEPETIKHLDAEMSAL